ncbi:MAG: TRZ/ATZ family hydrolase [Gammaproteobacteria bacterium]|nr:TRZ/ATZ family hydrolase [Gammaproteobacteria bacterium]
MQIDTLISAKWIIPIEPTGTVLEQHCLAIHAGRIVDIVPAAEANQFEASTHLKLPNHVLLPGLINAHGHAAMSLMRGIADDLPLMQWLNEHIWPAEQKHVSAEYVHDGSLLACAEMLRGGTTCFNDMYFFPEETARAAEQAGMRATVGLIVINFPSAWAQNADEYISKGLELHDQLQSNTLINTAFAPHAPYTVSDEPLQRILTLSEELDIPVHMHVHEIADEVEGSIKEHGVRPLERLDKLGLLNPNLVSVHMTQLTDDEIDRYANTGGHIVHCPESNLKLASGFCPINKLHQAGINLALGTDGAASNNDLDMFGEMRTAALLAKAVANDASAMPAEVILQMATLNGARALGLDQEIGSLVKGKAADVIAVNLSGIETEPVYNPISQLVYATGRERVTDVWVAGKHLLKDRQLTTIDVDDVVNKARQWQQKLAD